MLDGRECNHCNLLRALRSDPKQYDATFRGQSLDEGQFAKVFVESQQDAALRHAQFQNFNVCGSRVAVGDPDYIQSCVAQRFEGWAREVFIRQEPHVISTEI